VNTFLSAVGLLIRKKISVLPDQEPNKSKYIQKGSGRHRTREGQKWQCNQQPWTGWFSTKMAPFISCALRNTQQHQNRIKQKHQSVSFASVL